MDRYAAFVDVSFIESIHSLMPPMQPWWSHQQCGSDVTVHATSDAAHYGTGKQTSLHTSSSSEQHLDGVVEADARILPRGPTLMYGEDSDDFDSDNYSSGSDV